MRPETLLHLLASYKSAGEPPAGNDCIAIVEWLRKCRHNIRINLAFFSLELQKRSTKGDETYLTMCDITREGSEALVSVNALIRSCARSRSGPPAGTKPRSVPPRRSKDFNNHLSEFRSQYDTLGGSVGHVFLLLNPALEREATDLGLLRRLSTTL